MESLLVYAGLVLASVGLLCVLKPVAFLRIRTRRRGALLGLAGILLTGLALLLPVRAWHVQGPRTRLDDFIPVAQFGERHSVGIHASRERVERALRTVTADEIRLYRTLTWIRSPRVPWRQTPESILAPSAHEPILTVALRSGFSLLAEEPGREIVLGTVVCCRHARIAAPGDFLRLEQPGYAKAAMNFRLEEKGAAETLLTTETRVFATDPRTARRFATYWRFIYPGSALIRRMWLRAVKERAEGQVAPEARSGNAPRRDPRFAQLTRRLGLP